MLKALRESTLKQRVSRDRVQLKVIKKNKRKSSITKAKEERKARLDSLQREIQENQRIIQEGISSLSSLPDCPENSDSSSTSVTSDTVLHTGDSC